MALQCGPMRLSYLCLILLAGCPGKISNPEPFLAAAGKCDAKKHLFATTCGGSGCHGAADPAGSLDLESPDPASRLVDVPSLSCPERVLIDSKEPNRSYLLERVALDPTCGEQTPHPGDPLEEWQLDCIEDWIDDVLGVDEVPDGGVADGSTDAVGDGAP